MGTETEKQAETLGNTRCCHSGNKRSIWHYGVGATSDKSRAGSSSNPPGEQVSLGWQAAVALTGGGEGSSSNPTG